MSKLSLSAQPFDLGLAALAAVSAGFVAFAMPEPILSGIVSASSLPDFLPAAQPPLGETARLAIVAIAGLFTFAFVWSLLAAIDRLPRPAPAVATAQEMEAEAPRLRRADAHPDAPARRPLVAGRDLGEPLLLDEVEPAPMPAPEPEVAAAPPVVDPAPEPEPQPEPVAEVEALPEAETLAELAERLPDGSDDGQSLTELVGRVESGFGRKRQALERTAPPLPEPKAEAEGEEERVGHRLRSAISELQKISARA